MQNKNSLNIMKFRQKNTLKSVADKIEIKSFILPKNLEKDESTISHVKRIGGQVMQFYSMHTMDAEVGGNDIFYYLISDIYSVAYEEDNSKHDLPYFNIEVISTRRELVPDLESYSVAKTANFLALDLYKEISYTNKSMPFENFSVPTAKLVSFDLTDDIRYTRIEAGSESFSGTGSRLNSLSLEEFPFLIKSVSEETKSKMTSFEVKFSV